MLIRWSKRIAMLVIVCAVISGFYLALKAKPVRVDVAVVSVAPMSVTINEEGIAQVKDVYTVSSPIAGHLSRTTLEEGDSVRAHSTVVASIHPLDSPFLDQRTRQELQAALEAARSAVALATVDRDRVLAAHALAKIEYQRALKLTKTNTISESAMDKAYSELRLQEAQLGSADAMINLRQAEYDSALARLAPPRVYQNDEPADEQCCVEIIAPIDGVILTMFTRSEQALAAGTLIAEIGDPDNVEIVVDLLSSDAVRIQEGASAEIGDWGGDNNLSATVTRIDPAAFTKVSALGIEEQRVNVVLDLNEASPGLGHGFRVFARLSVWAAESVEQVPLGALFRSGGDWAVFIVEQGAAKVTPVSLGHMNAETAEIVAGLSVDEQVILYPNDLIADGSLVELRERE